MITVIFFANGLRANQIDTLSIKNHLDKIINTENHEIIEILNHSIM